MDRLKRETTYRRALDVLMSAADERQLLFGICLKLQDFKADGARSPHRQ
jgi:hypothetical protein